MQFPTQSDMQRNASLGGISSGLKDLNVKIDQDAKSREKSEKITRRLAIASLVTSILTLAVTVLFGILGLTA